MRNHGPKSPIGIRARGASKALRQGFTLIEILATMLLLGIVVVPIVVGINVSESAASNAKHSVEAATLGEAKLNEIIVTQQWQNGNLSGDFMPDNPGYTWQVVTQSKDLDITELDMEVDWDSRGQKRSIKLATYVYANATTSGSSSGLSQ